MTRTLTLTDELSKAICDNVRLGSWAETAAAAAGVSRMTICRWLRAGKKAASKPVSKRTADEKRLAKFSEDMAIAAAESEMLDIARIAQAGQTVWQACAWRLERRYPDRWGNDRQALRELMSKVKSLEHLLKADVTPKPDATG